ncbi:MAG: ATP-dependent RNA helicase HrpA [Gammaproteobacteria bacterium]|nr:ATP-dependent RNA helicase HrpA [Gammaproteobacteria bacterium]
MVADKYEKQITKWRLDDQRRLFSQLKAQNPSVTQDIESLHKQIRQVMDDNQEAGEVTCPIVGFSMDLPIHAWLDEIKEAIQQHQVVIICGATGSGKTTQLPKICLTLGRGINGLIGHTQPRRIAAKTVATRIAEELATPLGEVVGFKIRHSDKTSNNTYIKLMTDGILLAEMQHDGLLETYDTLIIDEAHERSLNIDFILGYLKQLLPIRPDLKIIITSATIDIQRFSEHFDNAPVIEVSGRTYPVEVRYRPMDTDESGDETINDMALLAVIRELSLESHGDILIFLEGEREIHETVRFLNKQKFSDTDILPLYARLDIVQQAKIFKPHRRRYIILATNVAETSLTIPGICYVIDRGLARISRYNRRSKVQQLPVEKISQASAEQRKGRCGRIAPGICIRLYSNEDFAARPLYTDAEILRTNLASVILRMKALELVDIREFPFIDKPDLRYINDGVRLLTELKAVDTDGNLTSTGRQLARLPIDPRYGKILLAAHELSCITEVLIIVSALSVQDPRIRPLDTQEKADKAHQRFADDRSDFMWFLNLWNFYHERSRHLSRNRLRKLCNQNFLSFARIREWKEVHKQLSELLSEMGIRENTEPANYNNIHCALLSGLLSHIAIKSDHREYTGARGIKLNIFPGSDQFSKLPKWIVAAELTETTRLYARTVASIDPQWLIKPAEHLLLSQYFEPHWDTRAQQVMAYEKVTLYGLILIPRRRINYGRVNPVEARRIFIRDALVEGNYKTQAGFFEFNHKLMDDIRLLEQKSRRLDILNEDSIYKFYDLKIPASVCNGPAFEKWYLKVMKANSKFLFLNKVEIMNHPAELITDEHYPDSLKINQNDLPLTYRFKPGEIDDGITLDVPLPLLNQLDHGQLERLLAPSILEEKIALMLKSLPKRLRRNLMPIQDFAQECARNIMMNEKQLEVNLAEYVFRNRGIEIPHAFWQSITLPEHYRVRVRVLNEKNEVLTEGRSLTELREKLSGNVQKKLESISDTDINRDGITAWDFGKLPDIVNHRINGLTVRAYPAIVDMDKFVSIRCFDTAEKACITMRSGLLRLFMLALKKDINYLKKNLPHIDRMCINYLPIGSCDELKNDLVRLIIERVFIADNYEIRSQDEFNRRRDNGIPRLMIEANDICDLVHGLLEKYHAVKTRVTDNIAVIHADTIDDIQNHLCTLVFNGFIRQTPLRWLRHYPRYLDAINKRLEKLFLFPHKDKKQSVQLKPFLDFYKQLTSAQQHFDISTQEMETYRWMLEEYRVSLFAQELKTAMSVSVERLQQQLEKLSRVYKQQTRNISCQ